MSNPISNFKYNILTYGRYKDFFISENQKIKVLDGKLWRKKRRIKDDAAYRRKNGIKSNGVKKIFIPENLITVKKASKVNSDDYLLTPLPSSNGKDVCKKDLEKAWMIGLCIADGSISKEGYGVGFNCSIYDKYRFFLRKILSYYFNDNKLIKIKHRRNSRKARKIICTRKKAHLFFSKYIIGKLTDKQFTKEIFNLSKEEILWVLGGYFDGDGHFSKEELKLIANNYSEKMANQIWRLLMRVGIRASLKKYSLDDNHYKTKSTHYYHIIIPSSDVPLLSLYMNSNKVPKDFIPKKYREFSFFYSENKNNYFCQPIRKIEKILG